MAQWYVDNAASGSNNGTSWANAWQSFAAIVWGGAGVVAGDFLDISGGTVSKTYAESLVLGAGGYIGTPITVRVGQSAGHNGAVIISNGAIASGLVINGHTYLTVSGRVLLGSSKNMQITGMGGSGINVAGVSHHFTLEYLDSSQNGNADNEAGLWFNCDHQDDWQVDIHHCRFNDNAAQGMVLFGGSSTQYGTFKVRDCQILLAHDDNITLGLSADIYNCEFSMGIERAGAHLDGIQFTADYVRVFSNHFHDVDPASRPNAAVYMDPFGSGQHITHVQVFNNLIDTDGVTDLGYYRGIEIDLSESGCVGGDTILVANNTLVGVPFVGIYFLVKSALGHGDIWDVQFLNNLFVDCGRVDSAQVLMTLPAGDGTLTYGSIGSGADVVVDYNSAYASSGSYYTDVSFKGTTYSFANYKTASGCDTNGFVANPLLDADFVPDVSSPLVGEGDDLSVYFTTDKYGTPRGSSWEAGCYESGSAPPVGEKLVMVTG